MAQITLKIKIDIPGLQEELDKAILEIKQKLSAVGVVDIDTTNAKKQIVDVGNEAKNTEDKLSKWSLAVTGFNQALEITRKIWNVINSSIEAFENRQRAIREINTTIESMGNALESNADKIVEMSDKLEEFNKYAVDANDIMTGASFLIGFEKMNSQLLPRATQLTIDLSRRMGTDMKEAAMTLGIALENPEESYRRLRSAGIIFDDAQKTIISHMVETGNVAGAQEKIFDALEKKIGGFARNTVTNVESVKLKILDLKQTLMEGLGDAFSNYWVGLLEGWDMLFTKISNGYITLGILDKEAKARADYKEFSREKMFKDLVTKASDDAYKETIKYSDQQLQSALKRQKELVDKLSKTPIDASNYDWQKNYYDQQLAIQKKYEDQLEARRILSLKSQQDANSNLARDRKTAIQQIELDNQAKLDAEKYFNMEYLDLEEERISKQEELKKIELQIASAGSAKQLDDLKQKRQLTTQSLKIIEEAQQQELKLADEKYKQFDEKRNKDFVAEQDYHEKIQQLKQQVSEANTQLIKDDQQRELALLNDQMLAEINAADVTEEQKTLILQKYEALRQGIINKYAEENLQNQKEKIEELTQEYESHISSVLDAFTNSINYQRTISDADVELEQLNYNKELEALKEQLLAGEISQEEYRIRERAATEQHNAYLRQVEEDRLSGGLRFAREVQNILLNILKDYVVKYVSQKLAEAAIDEATETEKTASLLAGSSARTSIVASESAAQSAIATASITTATALSSAAMQVIAAAAATAATLVSIATFGSAAVIGEAALIQAIATVKAMSQFKVGGHTGSGNPDEIAGFVHKEEHVFESDLVKKEPDKFELLHKMLRSGITLSDIISAITGTGKTEPADGNKEMLKSGITVPQVFTMIANQVNPIIEAPQALAGIDLNYADNIIKRREGTALSDKVYDQLIKIEARLKTIEEKGIIEVEFEELKEEIRGENIYKIYQARKKVENKRTA